MSTKSRIFSVLPVMLCCLISNTYADGITAAHAQRIAQKYSGIWTTPPTVIPTGKTADAPLLGNGDLGAAIAGNISAQTYYLGKNDFWCMYASTAVMWWLWWTAEPLARLTFSIPAMAGSSYSMTQDIYNAEVRGNFGVTGRTLQTTSWISSTDNVMVIAFSYTGSSALPVTVSLDTGLIDSWCKHSSGASGNVSYLDVRADSLDVMGGWSTIKARTCARLFGATPTITGNRIQFTVQPGVACTLATVAVTSHEDSLGWQTTALQKINGLTKAKMDSLNTVHRQWWKDFYSRSFVEIADKNIEKVFYGSLYVMGSSTRADKIPPGLWGPWIFQQMDWWDCFTTDYNQETQFYACYPTNHCELADCFDNNVLANAPRGKAYAASRGWSGLFMDTWIPAYPVRTRDYYDADHMVSCGSHLAANFIMRYYYTGDVSYAAKVYDYLKDCATFWRYWATKTGGRYVFNNDVAQEKDPFQTNSILSLGLARMVFKACIDMSTALNRDAALRAGWQNFIDSLSQFPTQVRSGQTIFRPTEVGRDWITADGLNGPCPLVQGPVYPSGIIGPESDSAQKAIARNTFTQIDLWSDGCAPSNLFPAAARVGYHPDTIIKKLDAVVANSTYRNLYPYFAGGGIENENIIPSTLAEMICQSSQNKLRVFYNWPKSAYAKFGDLRAYGGFLVSSDMEAGAAKYIRVISEQGKNCTFVNPWPGQTLAVYRNGVAAPTVSGTEITLATSVNEVIYIVPNGISYDSVQTMMRTNGGGGGMVGARRGIAALYSATSAASVTLRAVAGKVIIPCQFAGKQKLVSVYDLSGKLIKQSIVKYTTIDLRKHFGLAGGVYIVHVKAVR